jgi:hypothetical protein
MELEKARAQQDNAPSRSSLLSKVVSPSTSFISGAPTLSIGISLVVLGRPHLRYSSYGRDLIDNHNASCISSLISGGRPSLSTLGCLTISVVNPSRSQRLLPSLPKRELNNEE